MQNGWTPLNYAANNGPADVASALIEAGADISAANKVRSSILLFYLTYMYFTLPCSTTPISMCGWCDAHVGVVHVCRMSLTLSRTLTQSGCPLVLDVFW